MTITAMLAQDGRRAPQLAVRVDFVWQRRVRRSQRAASDVDAPGDRGELRGGSRDEFLIGDDRAKCGAK